MGAASNAPILSAAQMEKIRRGVDPAGAAEADQAYLRLENAKKKPSMGGTGRSGTILTSPLGTSTPGVGAPPVPAARKTILGG